jgi:hypothetical protein
MRDRTTLRLVVVERMLGTSQVVDMATSACAHGKVEIAPTREASPLHLTIDYNHRFATLVPSRSAYWMDENGSNRDGRRDRVPWARTSSTRCTAWLRSAVVFVMALRRASSCTSRRSAAVAALSAGGISVGTRFAIAPRVRSRARFTGARFSCTAVTYCCSVSSRLSNSRSALVTLSA